METTVEERAPAVEQYAKYDEHERGCGTCSAPTPELCTRARRSLKERLKQPASGCPEKSGSSGRGLFGPRPWGGGVMDDLTLVRGLYEEAFVPELAARIRQVAEACKAVGKSGSITVKIEVKPEGVGEKRLLLPVTFASSLPKSRTRDTVMYLTDGGEMQRNNPDQPPLSGFEVVSSQRDIRDVGAAAPDKREA